MFRRILICVTAILTSYLPSTLFAAVNATQHSQIESTLLSYQNVIVRVSFEDADIGRQIASQFEPMQSFYDQGYVTLHLDAEEYSRLAEIAANHAITVTLNEALTNKHITGNFTEIPDALSTQAIPSFACYRTVEETFATAQAIANNNPTLATWTDVGDSWEKANGLGGYDSMVLKLTNSDVAGPKPKIFITSAIHAREYTTAELMTRFAEKLVADYGTDPDTTWILDHQEVHMMLVANPDGRKQAETGLLWRKNTNQNYCGPTSQNRGADLNRNFSFEWGCCNGSSTNQCSQTFRGSGPSSEPEAEAVEDYLLSNFSDDRGPNADDAAPLDKQGIYLDIHSSGRLMLWPWGSTSNPAPNSTQLQTLGRKMAFFNGHEPKQSIGLYPTDGTTTSYAYGELGLAAYTYELGTEFFENCTYFENTLIPDNMPALMYALKSTRAPYQTPAGPDATNVSTSIGDAGVPAGTQIDLTATLDDTRFNNQNGTEPTQNVSAAEFYIDTPPWQAGASAVAMLAADGAFNSSVETATAAVDTTGLSDGRHTVFVRSQDTAGNWGTVTAAFINIDANGSIPTTVFEDNFESNLGWTVNPNSNDTATTGQWQRANPEATDSNGPKQLGTTVSGSNDLVTGAIAGASAGTNDIDGGPTSIRSPDIQLPNADSISVSFSYYFAHTNNASTDDYLRVSAVSTSGTTSLLEELGAANDDDGVWQTFTGNLDALAGQQIYLFIEAADAAGGSIVEAGIDDVAIIAFTSGGGNTPPVITSPGSQTDAEGDSVTLQIIATDGDGDTLSYSASGLPTGLSINSSGNINGTVTTAGTFTPTITVSDGVAGASASFSWTITPEGQTCNVYSSSNVPVSLPNGTNSISSTLGVSGSATITDVNASVNMPHAWPGDLIFMLTNGASGTAVTIIDQPGSPASNFGCSNDNIDVTLDDDAASSVENACSTPPAVSGTLSPNNALSAFNGELANGTWTLTVTDTYPSADAGTLNAWSLEVCSSGTPPVNNPPVVTSPDNQSADEGDNISIQISATDADNDTLSYSASGLPAGVSINASTGLISGPLSFASAGDYSVDVNVSDGLDTASASFTLTVNNINRAPSINNPDNQISVEGDSVVLNVTATDADGDSIAFSASGLPANLAMSSTGTINGSLATGSAGTYSVTVTASDGTDSSSTTFDWTVTDGSVACTTYTSTNTPISLPNGTASITSSLSVNGASAISDVNVRINMPHVWPGDLTFTLSNQSSGTVVMLIDRPGVPASTWGCSNDNIDVTLDDAAASPVESACATPPAISGTLSPSNALSAFNGESANGTWVLTVTDAYTTADAGTLNSWSVEICGN